MNQKENSLNSSKSLDTLVSDIYSKIEVLGQNENLEIPDDLIEDFGERMKEVMRHWTTPKEQSKGLRMSNIGRPARQLWYESRDEEDKRPSYAPTYIKFLYGHMLEEVLLLLVKIAGHDVTDEQKEVEVDDIKGHIDCKINGEVIDIKTASNFGFRKFKENNIHNDDPFGYMHQLSGYEAAEGTNEGGFLAINKETGELALARPLDLTKPDTKTRIESLKNYIKQDSPPDKCYYPIPEGKKGNMRLASGCVYCKFKNECWSDVNNGYGLRAFKYSNGIKYFTKVMSTPNVLELRRDEQ